jgi:hypothetical protein
VHCFDQTHKDFHQDLAQDLIENTYDSVAIAAEGKGREKLQEPSPIQT